MDKYYAFKIDPNSTYKEYNLSKEAATVLVALFRDYFINSDKKEILNEMLRQNDKKAN